MTKLERHGPWWVDENGAEFDLYYNEKTDTDSFISPYTGEILDVVRKIDDDHIIVE